MMPRPKWRVAKIDGAWFALSPWRTMRHRFENWERAIAYAVEIAKTWMVD
jgi:hypothetical protein